jgi:hypothetical protein
MPESLEHIRQLVESAYFASEAAHRELQAWIAGGISDFPGEPEPEPEPLPDGAAFPVPLTDAGGLYGNGSNEPPASHLDAGLAAAATVPATGAMLQALGMSTTTQVYHAWRTSTNTACYMPSTSLAAGGMVANSWDEPGDNGWARLTSGPLFNKNIRGEDFDVLWVLLVSDLYGGLTVAQMDAVLDQIRFYLPNLKMIFVNSYNYLGYKSPPAEPACGWNDGLVVREWVLSHMNETDPWIGWGPYFWANGETPRSDGLVWLPEDYNSDGHHPSASGLAKHVALMEAFFQTSPLTPWFRHQ